VLLTKDVEKGEAGDLRVLLWHHARNCLEGCHCLHHVLRLLPVLIGFSKTSSRQLSFGLCDGREGLLCLQELLVLLHLETIFVQVSDVRWGFGRVEVVNIPLDGGVDGNVLT